MEIGCKFVITKNGRVVCKTHKQDLIYLFSDGRKICQVEEDNLVTKLRGLDNFHKWMGLTLSTGRKENGN